MSPPPKAVRRLVIAPLAVAFGAIAAVVLLPIIAVGLVLLALRRPVISRTVRLLCFFYVYLVIEVVGLIATFGLWVATCTRGGLGGHQGNRNVYRLLLLFLGWLRAAATVLFRLRIADEGVPDHLKTGHPVIVASRHAGPGDSFLLVYELLARVGRNPRVILKQTLLWDPLLDVLLSATPNVFVDPTAPTARVVEQIATLAASMGPDDALLIFPEGGNFTSTRRARVIDRLERDGHLDAARRAADLERLLAPRLTGLHAALSACPTADVAVVAHTGLDDLNTLADIWVAVPQSKTLLISWEQFPASQVPRDGLALVDWLGYQWQLMDVWVARQSAVLYSHGRGHPGPGQV